MLAREIKYKDYAPKILLLVIIFIGFFLRLYLATSYEFWIDEVTIFTTTRIESLKSLFLIEHWDAAHPQLFYMFAHLWQKIHTQVLFLRTPILATWFLASFAWFWAVKQITKVQTALISTSIFAVFIPYVNVGFQFKPYAFCLMFTILSIAFLSAYYKYKRTIWGIFFSLSSILAFYSDYAYVWFFISLSINLFLFGLLKKHIKKNSFLFIKTLRFWSLAAMGMIIDLPIFLKNLEKATLLEKYIGTVSLESFLYWFKFSSGGGYTDLSYWPPWWSFIVFAISSIGFYLFFQKKHSSWKEYIAATIFGTFIITPVLSFVISQYSPVFVPRNMFLTSLFYLTGMAFAFDTANKFIQKIIVGSFITIFISYSGLLNIQRLGFFNKNWYSIAQKIQSTHEILDNPTLCVLQEADFISKPLTDYYLAGYGNISKINFNWKEISSSNYLEKIESLECDIFLYPQYTNVYAIDSTINNELFCKENVCVAYW